MPARQNPNLYHWMSQASGVVLCQLALGGVLGKAVDACAGTAGRRR